MGTNLTAQQLEIMGLIPDGKGGYRVKPKEKSLGKITPLVENKKIIGATKCELDGYKFDSKLEMYMYTLLRNSGLVFDMQVVYLLQEKFRYGTEAVRAITLKVDFVIPSLNVICDTKGFNTQQSAMRYKMLKKVLWDEGNIMTIHIPTNKKECDSLIYQLTR